MDPKTQQWDGKVMASVFWAAHGILFIDYLEKGKTINQLTVATIASTMYL